MFPADLMDLMRKLFPLRRYFCSPDYDKAINLIADTIPLRRHCFSRDETVNHWQIPPHWDYKTARICRNGNCIYDASPCPLQIIALSTSFQGTVSREQLRQHLHFDHRNPKWVPWHFRQLYRPWDRTWGFCVTKEFYDSLEPGDYDVEIETVESDEPLTVIDYEIAGKSNKTIALVAHLDHPHMANDDLAGVIVGLRVMQLLAEQERKFSYRLVIVQEIVGSEYYLNKMRNRGEHEHLFGGLFLEMLGTRTPFALQSSFNGNSPIDQAIRNTLNTSNATWSEGPFATVIGNDETNWEAHGIAMPSLSRFPYEQYHSDHDNMDIIYPECLEESARVVLESLDWLEHEKWVTKTFTGVPCLSNPELDLYIDPGQPALGQQINEQDKNLRRLMSALPMELATTRRITELATAYDLSADTVEEYLKKWQARGLVELI